MYIANIQMWLLMIGINETSHANHVTSKRLDDKYGSFQRQVPLYCKKMPYWKDNAQIQFRL